MKLNGVDIKLNLSTKKDYKTLKKAFDVVFSKSKKLDSRLIDGTITQEKREKKEINLIRNFFETILTFDDAKRLLATCSSYGDYYKIFRNFVQLLGTTSVLLDISKRLKDNKKKI